ncbi:MAG: adenosylmethionine--8-amino-7-oxononanoate transaminase [Candidatus Omnitrophota bacterium]
MALKGPAAPQKNAQADKLHAWDKRFVWHPFTQMKDYIAEDNLMIEEGKGNYLKDVNGRWFLDGISSLWVNAHGHRNSKIDNAIREQLKKISHSTLLGCANIPSVKLAKRLVEAAPKGLSKVFYSDSGSTAVEIALKMAFQYWRQHPQKSARKKKKFISFINAYHGDTIGSVSVGGMDLFHKIYEPLLFKNIKAGYPYCYRCGLGESYPGCGLKCAEKLENTIRDNRGAIAALIIEPLVQAAAGMLVSPPGFLKKARALCDKYGIIMIADEVAVGFGRTGRMFACEKEKVTPDIMALAKGITGGYLPLAATIATDRIYEGFLGEYGDKKTFFHGHTYTGNQLACAAALANLDLFNRPGFFKELNGKIEFLKDGLERFRGLAGVGDIRQEGMMAGIELVRDKAAKAPYEWEEKIGIRVAMQARRHGVMLRPLGNVVVLMPPLSVTRPQIRHLLNAAYDAIKDICVR